jgi:hypothetical protein
VSDGHDQALVAAIFQLLALDPILSTKAFDGFVPTGTTVPYVVVYTTMDRPSLDPENGLDARSRIITGRWYCHCVGGSAAAARAMVQRVRNQLIDVRPAVDGMNTGMIREISGPPAPFRDEATGVLLIDAVVIFELRASI